MGIRRKKRKTYSSIAANWDPLIFRVKVTRSSKLLTEALISAPSSLVVEPRVYITGPNYPIPEMPTVEYGDLTSPSPPVSPARTNSVSSINKEDKFGLPVYSALKLLHGRPSIPKVLNDEITSATGPVSVDGQCSWHFFVTLNNDLHI